jgi:hypothetical protein
MDLRSGGGGEQIPAQGPSGAKRREVEGVFEPTLLSVKLLSLRRRRAVSIDGGDDEWPRLYPRLRQTSSRLSRAPKSRRAVGAAARFVNLVWKKRRRRAGGVPERPSSHRSGPSRRVGGQPSARRRRRRSARPVLWFARQSIETARERCGDAEVRRLIILSQLLPLLRPLLLTRSTRSGVAALSASKIPTKADAASADSGASSIFVSKSRRATAASRIPIDCEGIEALGTLRWSCVAQIVRFTNPVPAVARTRLGLAPSGTASAQSQCHQPDPYLLRMD